VPGPGLGQAETKINKTWVLPSRYLYSTVEDKAELRRDTLNREVRTQQYFSQNHHLLVICQNDEHRGKEERYPIYVF
jgi:hypothetical protein